MDQTSQKIINAAMELIMEIGYTAATTKDIANLAKVNECTLFRKFKNKKDIVLNGTPAEEAAKKANDKLNAALEILME